MSYIRNIKTYYFYSTFAELLILGPIMILYLFEKGLSFTEIAVLQSFAAICVVLFEVPTGAVADRIGRKWSMILASMLWGVSLLVYIMVDQFILLALAEGIFSLGAAFKSGSDTALIYDSLKEMKEEHHFQKIEGNARSLSLVAQAVGSVIAGYVYAINIHLPFVISVGFMIITMIITLFFKEPDFKGGSTHLSSNYFSQIKDSGKFILGHEKIKAIILFSMVFFIFYRMGFLYFQPYMESIGIPVIYFGWIFFAFNITAAITSKYIDQIMSFTKPRTLTVMAGLIIISFFIMGFTKVWIGVIAILLQQVARGMYRPVTRKYLNKHIPSDKRATILSFQGLLTSIAAAATMPLMGMLKDATNIFTTHIVLAIIMTIMVLLASKYMNNRLGLKTTNNP
ncbi:MFS transporter [Clostridium sp. D2Q-11]|uniref:MFS transporter n=1 Tax=Anaeromonas frigoriresistens TaxID=2683708 RepID=A0A942Z4Y1_9FIRM|nr:MFS transporter [Anaeromonas frigoriresistens]MBS4536826.1 MFS transporter [Anaeromonas frigoriresistens]